jgi:hypothetical protein
MLNSTRFATSLLFALAFLPAAARAQTPPPVHLVLFTHIEDNTPAGTLGSAQSRQNYLLLRSRLIDLAHLAADSGVPWSLQPDWKILQAAILYEDTALMETTNGKNFLRYLKEDIGSVVDPHSHESGGYNYTDIAHLLDSLGVGMTTVIGGHVWDPSLPQFQEWDRYRVPVAGERYPWAEWRGDILMGSGTPNHVNDPIVSGVWRPRDRFNYFDHDSTANIVAIGQYRGTLEGVPELISLYESGSVPLQYLLTTSYHIKPATITRAGGIADIADSVITPVLQMQADGLAVATDFTSLVETWQTQFGSRGFLYDAENPTSDAPERSAPPVAVAFEQCSPNPFAEEAVVRFSVSRETWVRLTVFDVLGRRVATLVDEAKTPGPHTVSWNAGTAASGVYLCRLEGCSEAGEARGRALGRKLMLIR